MAHFMLPGNNKLNYKSSNLDSKHGPSRGCRWRTGKFRSWYITVTSDAAWSLLTAFLTDGAIYRFISQTHPPTRGKERVELNCIWTSIKQLALIFACGN